MISRCDLIEQNRNKYREAAKVARAANRDMECKRNLRLYKQTEEDYQRYSVSFGMIGR